MDKLHHHSAVVAAVAARGSTEGKILGGIADPAFQATIAASPRWCCMSNASSISITNFADLSGEFLGYHLCSRE
jgi:hypothetical protein